MKLAFKQILANVLVIMVILLPLRAMAMPVDVSSSHCMSDGMAGDMSAMNHESQQMPAIAETDQQTSKGQCCKQCTADCADCASMTVVILGFLQFSDIKNHEVFTVTADLLFTHITSPPSRPPQILTI
jgi:hypothetical protein